MDLPRPKWYTVDELAEYWGKDSKLVKRYIETGQLVSSIMFCNSEDGSTRWVTNVTGHGWSDHDYEQDAYYETGFPGYVLLEDAERFEKEHGQASGEAIEKDINPLIKRSLLKMVLAMAMDGYGYDPEDSKSTVTQEIATAVTVKLDETIDPDTVRKYLKEASSLYKNRN